MHKSNLSGIETLRNNRPTIAVLSASLNSFYHEGITRGAADGAEERGVNLIIYSGGPFNSPDPTAQSRESVFNLVDMNLIDGIIIPIGSHTRYLKKGEINDFIGQFSSVPIINLSSSIEGCYNIIPDFRPGLAQLMNHFVNDHSYRNIAFFRGPRGHIPSDHRTELFREELKKHNLPVDENLIVYSDMGKKFAAKYVSELLDKRGAKCDAIITLNDSMALGIIQVLVERGYSVPGDIAVAGTLDDPAGLFSHPPLTTIKEPVYEMGKTAVHALADILDGKECQRDIYIPTTLVKRKSCGCQSAIRESIKEIGPVSGDREFAFPETHSFREEDLIQSCTNILEQSRCLADLDILTSILEEYEEGRMVGDFSGFFKSLRTHMDRIASTENVLGWLAVIARIQMDLLSDRALFLQEDSFYDLFMKLIVDKNRIEDKLVKFHRYELGTYNSFFTHTLSSLNSEFDLKAVKKSTMELLQISDFYISVYIQEGGRNPLARNVMAVRENRDVEVYEECSIYPASQLVPGCVTPYDKRYSLMVFPLSFRKKPLGYLVFDLSSSKGTFFENLQVIISTALKNELQVQDLKKAEERFSDIAHSTSNWLWETDYTYHFTYSSLSVTDILGYSVEDVLDKSIKDFSLPESDYYYQRMLNQESLSDVECWFKHKNGKIMCLLISAKPIKKDGIFTGYRGVFDDITEQKFQEDKINRLAYYDILTDLPNRAQFQEKLEKIINISALNNKEFALMFIDIDRFKYINDSLGHDSGDLLLKEVGKKLGSAIRERDILARLGGDEFTIILPDIDVPQVIMIAERIMKRLSLPVKLNDTNIHVTISLGIALFPMDGEDMVSLLKKADNAMYQAKKQGRNGYVFYDRMIEKKNAGRKLNEENLYHALDHNEFILHYQPQVDTETGELKGLEALVRIEKEGQIIYPDSFIPLAEEVGMISRIDEWVFGEACRQYREWRDEGSGKFRISVNVSARQLRFGDLANRCFAVMDKYRVEPEDIKLEVTENVLIKNKDKALEILLQFKKRGVSIALDDFGTGYSSLQFINRYPIDTVKIDKSFVRGAFANKKSEAIIEAIVHLARKLDLNIIAEGVETAEQHEFIKSLGCDEIQGYYFFKPRTAGEIRTAFGKK